MYLILLFLSCNFHIVFLIPSNMRFETFENFSFCIILREGKKIFSNEFNIREEY